MTATASLSSSALLIAGIALCASSVAWAQARKVDFGGSIAALVDYIHRLQAK
jgi:hypothetical protein